MGMPEQKGLELTDILGNHYLFCNDFDSTFEVSPTHLTHVSDPYYGRLFLQELSSVGPLGNTLRSLYQYVRPHCHQLHSRTDWDVLDQLLLMMISGELKVWLLYNEMWQDIPNHIGMDAPMAGSTSGSSSAAPKPASKPRSSSDDTSSPTASASVHETYTPHPDVSSPKAGSQIHKRLHFDGNSADPYTAEDGGAPLGAKLGDIPLETEGLKELPEDYENLRDEGWPDLNFEYSKGRFAGDYKNFADIEAVSLPPNTKIFRIVDEFSNDAGAYWALELPKNKSQWRGGYAVKDSWNDNGYYVEHEVGNDGLKVWKGTVAGQQYEDSDYHLEGGDIQLFVTPNSIETTSPKLTNWVG